MVDFRQIVIELNAAMKDKAIAKAVGIHRKSLSQIRAGIIKEPRDYDVADKLLRLHATLKGAGCI